jgi:hypothetical protein
MTVGKILALLFFFLSVISIFLFQARHRPEKAPETALLKANAPIEVVLDQEQEPKTQTPALAPVEPAQSPKPIAAERELPEANRIEELFQTQGSRLPIVETITYKSRVSWLKGRPAWLSDYASHYETSRHFIARSLNGKPDYLKQDLAEGDQINVLREGKPIEFHLIVDASRCKMWFYYVDLSSKEKVLIKTYKVGLGRPDSSKTSGLLTPLGKYSLGNRIAIYKPGVTGHHKGQKVDMVTVFGTRWIPFGEAISHCTASSKGFGLHGVPWVKKPQRGWEQDALSLGKYESDGCIRMASEDIEEIYAIVITKPAFIEIVKDFYQASLFDEDPLHKASSSAPLTAQKTESH